MTAGFARCPCSDAVCEHAAKIGGAVSVRYQALAAIYPEAVHQMLTGPIGL
jgi:hypothetical protein